jgi:hypothetical protein
MGTRISDFCWARRAAAQASQRCGCSGSERSEWIVPVSSFFASWWCGVVWRWRRHVLDDAERSFLELDEVVESYQP